MALNAVERRLLDLRYEWEAFAEDPTPRLLVWTVPGRSTLAAAMPIWLRTHRELEQAGIATPVVDSELLMKCLESMVSREPELRQLSDPRRLKVSESRSGS